MGAQNLGACLSELSGGCRRGRKDTEMIYAGIYKMSSRTGKRHRFQLAMGSRKRGGVGYMYDLRNFPEISPGETKQRVYFDHRQFGGNYKTFIGKGWPLQMVIGGYLKEGLLPVPFADSELRGKYQKALLNPLGGEIEDRARIDVRKIVGATQAASTRKSGLQCNRRALVSPALCVFSTI